MLPSENHKKFQFSMENISVLKDCLLLAKPKKDNNNIKME
jgi:hypothetical protein